jgi:hypothetical protein
MKRANKEWSQSSSPKLKELRIPVAGFCRKSDADTVLRS